MSTDVTTKHDSTGIEQSMVSVGVSSSDQILTVIEQLHACYDYCAVWKEPTQEGDHAVAQVERDKEVQQLVAAAAEARPVDHQKQVALAAYFTAEKRGFEPNHELDDWLAAEAEIAEAEQSCVTSCIHLIEVESVS